ncbi:right-handed parallel beta-helix repeat-containing protein [bacterium]|nr:right-handed parallel beta-helix repeat-containing protein [candidate division CSSED10-310 bacterium]
MKHSSWIISVGIMVVVTVAGHAAYLQTYGTFECMGVIADLDAGDDPDSDAVAAVQYRISGSSDPWRTGHELSRVDPLRFTGSLFGLTDGTEYDVRVSFDDPDGVLHGVTLEITGSTREEIDSPDPAASFFASPSGSGTACTEGSPCSLTEALNQAQPGDEVVLLDGVYYTGGITPPRSGTTGAPIAIRAAEDADAILDGSDPAAFTWSAAGGGIYQTALNTGDTHLVVVDGERIYPYQDYADMAGLIWGLSGFYCDGVTLQVHLLDGSDPAGHDVIISRYNHAFYIDGLDYLVFDELIFRYYGQGSYAKAIYLNNASENMIRDCTFTVNDLGVGIKRESHRNVIHNCSFNDTIFDWPWDAVKAGSELETGGIRFYSPCSGRGTIIRHNYFYDYFDGLGVCPDETGGETNETDVYRNHADDIGDDCIETDGECANVRIWNNRFNNTLVGISLAPVYTGPVYVMYNLITNTGAGINGYPGSPFKFNSGYGLSGPMFLYHNTCDAIEPSNHGLDIKAPGTWVNITTRNNIWIGTDYGVHNYNTSNPMDMDYDCIWTTPGNTLVHWNGVHYATLAEFTAATGQEPNGYAIEPEFVNIGNYDYRLTRYHPLVDAGVLIPGINDDDYIGNGPDIGAFEAANCCPDGDVDQSGVITAGDAQLAFLIALGLYSPTVVEECSADCNGNGDITAGDAQAIFLVVLGLGSCSAST